MCFVFISEQTATSTAYTINWLVFITEMKSVYSAVRTGSLNKAVCASSLKDWQRSSFGSCKVLTDLTGLKTETMRSAEPSVHTWQCKRRGNPEDGNFETLSYLNSCRTHSFISVLLYSFGAGIAQSVQRASMGWTVRVSNPGGELIFRTPPDRPWGQSSLLYNGYRVFPGGKVRPGRALTPF